MADFNRELKKDIRDLELLKKYPEGKFMENNIFREKYLERKKRNLEQLEIDINNRLYVKKRAVDYLEKNIDSSFSYDDVVKLYSKFITEVL